jgi:hypothetical protein
MTLTFFLLTGMAIGAVIAWLNLAMREVEKQRRKDHLNGDP